MNWFGNILFAAAMSLVISDSLYVGYVIPIERTHPGLAQAGAISILGISFLGLFIGNMRVPMSWLAWVVAVVLVAGIVMGLRSLA